MRFVPHRILRIPLIQTAVKHPEERSQGYLSGMDDSTGGQRLPAPTAGCYPEGASGVTQRPVSRGLVSHPIFNLGSGQAPCPREVNNVLIFLLLFIGLPLIEMYFLIQVGSEIGALPTIALSILTAIIGTWLVRLQGFGVLMRVRRMMDQGEVPALEVLDGALILVAGLFLLLPGFLTDTVGFLLLVPPLRRWVIGRYVQVVPAPGHGRHRPGEGQRVIEGDYRRDD